MAASNGAPMRPLRLARTVRAGRDTEPVLPVQGQLPARVLAPDWQPPTEDNGAATPRGELLVALFAPDAATAMIWRQRARVIVPPLWKGGKVTLHVVVQEPVLGDPEVLLALVDLGLIDAQDGGLVGYPSGLPA